MTAITPKSNFDYSVVSQEQAMQLQIISTRIKVRVQRTAEEMLAMGADLQEAKRVCKEDGKLFEDWCGSEECPVGYKTAQKLMSVQAELGSKKEVNFLFQHGFEVLSKVTQTRDEDIRAALLEHIEQEAEDGNKITQQEITALKKALVAEQNRVKDLEGEVFDAKAIIDGYKAESDQAKEDAKRMMKSRDKAIEELMEKESKIRKQKAALEDSRQALIDAQEVYEKQLEQAREEIAEEERNRPRTSEEVMAQQKRLAELKALEKQQADRMAEVAAQLTLKTVELNDLSRQTQLWTKVCSDFYSAAVDFQKNAVMLIGAAQAVKDIPITDELHSQIQTAIKSADRVAEELRDAISV